MKRIEEIKKSQFKNETAYKKYMNKLANKHHIVIETKSNGVDYWFSEKGKNIVEQKAKDKGLSIDDYLKQGLEHKKDLIFNAEIINQDGTEI